VKIICVRKKEGRGKEGEREYSMCVGGGEGGGDDVNERKLTFFKI
jgi:hypothetical protein